MMKMLLIRFIGGFVILCLLFACATGPSERQQKIQFTDLPAEETGITFSNQLIESDSINIIKYLYFYNGAGIGAADFNNDGKTDLFFASNQGTCRLYQNDSKDGTMAFSDISEQAGIANISGWNTGVSVADVNGDGLVDIYLCQVNYNAIRGQNRLLINKGNQGGIPVFADEAQLVGLDFQGLSTQSAFLDYDLDGDLDMYLMNHSVHSPENYAYAEVREERVNDGDRFYKNEKGTFVDITDEAGIYSSQIGYGLGLGIQDFNNDQYPDIYVGNDFHENDYLYLNNGNGTFSEDLVRFFGHTSQFTMGMDIADINNDGHSDIFTLDMMPENEVVKKSSVPSDNYDIYQFKHDYGYHYQLARNNFQLSRGLDADGNPLFSEVAQLLGVEDTDWSWSVLMEDFDQDGLKDIFITNGIVRRPNDLDYLNYISDPLVQRNAPDAELIAQMPEGAVPNYFFKNLGSLQFIDRSSTIGNNLPGVSTGAVAVDLDNDGDLDIVTNNINDKATILRNQSNPDRHISIELVNEGPNTQSLGAELQFHMGGELITRSIQPVRGFMSSALQDIKVGFNDDTRCDSIIVKWPDGTRQVVREMEYNTTMEVVKRSANINRNSVGDVVSALFRKREGLANFTHVENEYNDMRFEKMMPWLLSTQGPALAVGDVNNDGLEDFYIGGARGQAGAMFIQTDDSRFVKSDEAFWSEEGKYEDVDALFFDADGDQDLDLLVVSGGNDLVKDSPFYLDRLYLNDGFGQFEKNIRSLPLITEIGSSASAYDYDKDGDPDLALGTLVEARRYGFSRGGLILGNDGNGKFQDVTRFIAPELINIGMVTDIEWADIDSDSDYDLIVVGEWMPVTLFINNKGLFTKQELPNSTGLWRTIEIVDYNNDGLNDIIAGNFGTNTFLAQGELGLLISDHDVNSIFEPLIFYGDGEQNFPLASRDLIISQMNTFRNVHEDYKSFASSDFDSMFDPASPRVAKRIKIKELESCIFQNKGKLKFEKVSLPREAQLSPVFDVEMLHSGTELVMGGNFHEIAPNIGRSDASYGTVLHITPDYELRDVPISESGLAINGQVRSIKKINIGSDQYLIVARNNLEIQFWQIKEFR